MSRSLNIPVSIARCVPSGYCRIKASCARYLAPYADGRPIQDCSITAMLGYCGDYLPADRFMSGDKPEKQPTVHEAVKGLV